MLTQITDHALRARARLLEQYRNRPQLASFVAGMASTVQTLEDAIFAMIAQTAIPTATGVWLEWLGAIVGEERGAEGDAVFRRYILARILANRSHGTLEDVVRVLDAAFGAPVASPAIRELGRACLQVDPNTDYATSLRDRLIRLLASTRAAGVGQTLFWQADGLSKTFTFSVGAGLEVDADAGFGDTSAPLVGGTFAGAYRA